MELSTWRSLSFRFTREINNLIKFPSRTTRVEIFKAFFALLDLLDLLDLRNINY